MKKIILLSVVFYSSMLFADAFSIKDFQEEKTQKPQQVQKASKKVNPDFVFEKSVTDSEKYNISIAYKYGNEKEKEMRLDVLPHNVAVNASGEVKIFRNLVGNEFTEEPLFLGLRIKARAVESNKNKFIYITFEYNKMAGALRDITGISLVSVKKYKAIRNPSKRVALLRREPKIEVVVPILTKDSGVFYVPCSIGKTTDVLRGKLKMEVTIRRIPA